LFWLKPAPDLPCAGPGAIWGAESKVPRLRIFKITKTQYVVGWKVYSYPLLIYSLESWHPPCTNFFKLKSNTFVKIWNIPLFEIPTYSVILSSLNSRPSNKVLYSFPVISGVMPDFGQRYVPRSPSGLISSCQLQTHSHYLKTALNQLRRVPQCILEVWISIDSCHPFFSQDLWRGDVCSLMSHYLFSRPYFSLVLILVTLTRGQQTEYIQKRMIWGAKFKFSKNCIIFGPFKKGVNNF